MTRMTKEFSLVLLGSGLLTAGYFLWPDDGLEVKAQEQAMRQAGGRTHHPRHVFIPLLLTTPRYSSAPPTTANISRGGFGSTGHGVAAVS